MTRPVQARSYRVNMTKRKAPALKPPHVTESPASSAAWEELQRQMTLVLPDLEEDDFLVITLKQSNHFVQFAAQGSHGDARRGRWQRVSRAGRTAD